MRRIGTFIAFIGICISLTGCFGNVSTQNNNIFDEARAISIIIKDNPDFPSNPSEIITKKLPIGGKQGSAVEVKFTTEVERAGELAYTITLTKDWGIAVNGKYVKSFWRYNVTSDNVTLLESVDNEDLPRIIK